MAATNGHPQRLEVQLNPCDVLSVAGQIQCKLLGPYSSCRQCAGSPRGRRSFGMTAHRNSGGQPRRTAPLSKAVASGLK